MSAGDPPLKFNQAIGVTTTIGSAGRPVYLASSDSMDVTSSWDPIVVTKCYVCASEPEIGIFVRGNNGKVTFFCHGCVAKLNGGLRDLAEKIEVMEKIKESAE